APLTLVCLKLLFSWFFILNPIRLLFFHPLSKLAGPKTWAVTRWSVSRAIISGKSHDIILDLHKKYGPMVRIAPDDLAFQSISAWTDIGGHRRNGLAEMRKQPVFNETFKDNLLGVGPREDHSRMRRILSRGFAASTLQRQEPFLNSYVDKLISELSKRCDDGKALISIETWYSFIAFDIIVPKGLSKRVKDNEQLNDAKIQRRRAVGTERPDFMTAMIGNGENGESLSEAEITSNCPALMLGGAETISSSLSGTTYYLATNPLALVKAVNEVRSAFPREEQITLPATGQLKYLNAVLTESLRMFPPFSGASPRVVPSGGATIAGQFIPENTVVGIWHWSMSRSPRYFLHPDEFHPERWLDDPRFKNDQKQAYQPFAVGPRNCIGMNLAYAELRLVIARVLWNFDLQLDECCSNWVDDCPEYFGWEKVPLLVRLAPVQR
ncbi:hypothetical protein HYALB_00005278, partial [Hymenoscyphus albidus]